METQAHNSSENASIIGEHLVEIYDTSSYEASVIEKALDTLTHNRFRYTTTAYKTEYDQLMQGLRKYKVREALVKNIVPTVGRAVIAQRLAGVLTYTGTINYGALGTSSTAVTNSDTQLGAEVFRKVPAVVSASSNVATLQFFFTKTETSGTYQEWGVFIDGTASANTGQMLSHLLTGGWTKSSSETMTVLSTYTIN
jgi:hypothetical protein